MKMNIKTLLNHCQPLRSFVYGKTYLINNILHVEVQPRKGSRGECGKCGLRGPTYDTGTYKRKFEFVPIWGIAVFLVYAMRRIHCPTCGIRTERVPWAEGKHSCCYVYRLFLARWARRLSWSEVAEIFGTSWGVVYRSIRWVVDYGLAHRSLEGITSIGVDEVSIGKGHKYLTVVYQIDRGVRRLLWVGRERTEETLENFFVMLGKSRVQLIQFIASDMWKPYLKVIKKGAGHALHVLDRFHVVAKLQKSVDEVRTNEARSLHKKGYCPVLTKTRWCFLKRPENLTPNQKLKLNEVLKYDLRTVRAYLLKESFDAFWNYQTAYWAGWYLDKWCQRAMRSRLEPIKKFVKTIRAHRELLLNWFKAHGEISCGSVEGLNSNVKLAFRRARGFKTYDAAETALYHTLGRLPEPEFTHRFCC
jgi:transposase